MRSVILRPVAFLLALLLLAGAAAAQSKKRVTKASKPSASKSAKTKTTMQPYTGDPIPPPQAQEPQSDGVRRITPAEARAAQLKGTAIIVDVRNDQAYKAARIKGALLIPYGDVAARSKELPRNKLIITYCA